MSWEANEVVFWIVTVVMAGVGAWIGTYLREKGRNYATREDVQHLTRLTEEVRADVSGKVWLEQKRWDLKRDFYWELLTVLNELASAYSAASRVLPDGRIVREISSETRSRIKDTVTSLKRNEIELNRLIGVGRILLPQHVIEHLEKLDLQFIGLNQKYQLPSAAEQKMSDEESTEVDVRRQKQKQSLSNLKLLKDFLSQVAPEYAKESEDAKRIISALARNDLVTFAEAKK